MEHELKVVTEFMDPLLNLTKQFEIRKNDRDYKVGDFLLLREVEPSTLAYTGREVRKRVTFMLSGWGLQPGYVCLGLGHAKQYLPDNGQ